MLGIDLIELKKAKGFYLAHKDHLDSYFSPEEIAYIQQCRKPHENCAVLLAAKEAAFKALSRLGTGLVVFRNIEIILQRQDQFLLKLNGSIKRSDLKFSVFKNQKNLVVQCAGI